MARRGVARPKKQMRKRFSKTSGEAYQERRIRGPQGRQGNGADDGREARPASGRCGTRKTTSVVLGERRAARRRSTRTSRTLTLEGFFPCPKPAYSTMQRRSLLPVQDMLFYQDQLEEIERTYRRASVPCAEAREGPRLLSGRRWRDRRRHRGGASSPPWTTPDPGAHHQLGRVRAVAAVKDMIVWLPIDQIMTTIVQLVELRRSRSLRTCIEISGLSDIMRGADRGQRDGYGAQQLKTPVRFGQHQATGRPNWRASRAIWFASRPRSWPRTSRPDTLLEMSQLDIPDRHGHHRSRSSAGRSTRPMQ